MLGRFGSTRKGFRKKSDSETQSTKYRPQNNPCQNCPPDTEVWWRSDGAIYCLGCMTKISTCCEGE